MLRYWWKEFLRWVIWLFKDPPAIEIARIDPNRRCPVCGHKKGTIRTVIVTTGQVAPKSARYTTSGANVGQKIMCRHTCAVCGAGYHEDPVTKVAPNEILSCIPRNDMERFDDQRLTRER